MASGTRKLKTPKRKWWRRTPKSDRKVFRKLPSSWAIFKKAFLIIWTHKRLFSVIMFFYALVSVILIQGIGNIDVQSIKNEVIGTLGDNTNQVALSLSLMGYLIGSNTSVSLYQSLMMIVASLAVIWSLRQITAGHKVKAKDAYYRGMFPLVPFVLVILNILVKMIPFALGVAAYNVMAGYGLAISFIELLFWGLIAILLISWSVYMLVPSLLALYIVTLPGMTPIKAIKSAKDLVHFRRWTVIKKVLLMMLFLLLIISLIMLPIIMFAAITASWIFFVLSLLLLVLVNAYMYQLYRELLDHA